MISVLLDAQSCLHIKVLSMGRLWFIGCGVKPWRHSMVGAKVASCYNRTSQWLDLIISEKTWLKHSKEGKMSDWKRQSVIPQDRTDFPNWTCRYSLIFASVCISSFNINLSREISGNLMSIWHGIKKLINTSLRSKVTFSQDGSLCSSPRRWSGSELQFCFSTPL